MAEGVPTTVELTLLDVSAGGAPLAGAAVYLWHCDIAGRYSLYDQVAEENYLRGVQESDGEGRLTFEARRRSTPTWCSPTATRASSRRPPAAPATESR